MFVVEYKTKSTFGAIYNSNFINIGAHKAQSTAAAAEYAVSRLGANVEIIGVQYVGSL